MTRPPYRPSRSGRLPLGLRAALCLTLLCLVAACGSQPSHRGSARYAPRHYYPPPGPPSDPWGPYIREASGRFGVPDVWIRRVMRQESGGQEDVVSWAGAMGLMQVMPDTYAGLRSRYGLGSDPFDPHNNILAGTAYLREMYDRFGSPGFLAAYNAGPNRLDAYLAKGTPLPDETVNYVASIAPLLGPGTPMSGPLAVYADAGVYTPRIASRRSSGGCDPDAAYNPDGPCTPLRPAVIEPVVVASAVPSNGSVGCDPDAAYNPNGACTPLRQPTFEPVAAVTPAASYSSADCDPDAAYDPTRPCRPAPISAAVIAEPLDQPAPAHSVAFSRNVKAVVMRAPQPVSAETGRWSIQVGAFANLSTALAAADSARMAAPDMLRMARTELPPTTPFGGKIAYRARLAGLSPSLAASACARLSGRGLPCMTVPPARDSF